MSDQRRKRLDETADTGAKGVDDRSAFEYEKTNSAMESGLLLLNIGGRLVALTELAASTES